MKMKLFFHCIKDNRCLAFVLVALCVSMSMAQQGIYYDAVKLRATLQKDKIENRYTFTNKEVFGPILREYFKDNKLEKNPFFKDHFFVPGGLLSSSNKEAYALKNFATRIGGVSVTNVADGLAQFLVKRMKEELSITFFEQFNKELEKQKDMQKLFPSTAAVLALAGTEIYNYQRYLPALREAFEQDLDSFFRNAYEWSTTDPATGYPLLSELIKNEKVLNVMRLVFYVTRELDHGAHPGDILNSLLDEPAIELEKIGHNLQSSLQVTNIFSQSLRSETEEKYWISKSEAANLVHDEVLLRLYFGLIYQKTPDTIVFIHKGEKVQFRSVVLVHIEQTMSDGELLVKKLMTHFDQIEKALKELESRNSSVSATDYFLMTKLTAELFMTIIENDLIGEPFDKNSIEDIRFYIDHTSKLFADIESRAYNSGVVEIYTILNKALDTCKDKDKVLKPLLKYGTFMATVATAKSSEEVEAAIEAIALPAGSARIKKEAAWNIALNAYMGVFYGSEKVSVDGVEDKGKAAGVFAPVGIAVSRSFYFKEKDRFSLSLFGSLVDVGALASYRIKTQSSEVSTLPEIKLENIISPGAYLVLGLPRIPISIGYGYQISPQLRSVNDQSVELGERADRWSGFIAVDIPLVNIWSKAIKR